MGLFDGKKGLVFGIANDHSIAWAITQQLHAEGAEMGFTHLPDRDPERPRMERRLRKLVEPLDTKMIEACDVTNDEQLDHVFDVAASTYGNIDFMLHSIAYAPMDDLKGEVVDVSRDGFKLSMEISVYSLMTLTPAASETSSKTATLGLRDGDADGACDGPALGPAEGDSEGASEGSAVGDFDLMLDLYKTLSPLRRNVEADEVGKTGMFLLSDLASGITGETLHVDSGYHIMGAPPADARDDGESE